MSEKPHDTQGSSAERLHCTPGQALRGHYVYPDAQPHSVLPGELSNRSRVDTCGSVAEATCDLLLCQRRCVLLLIGVGLRALLQRAQIALLQSAVRHQRVAPVALCC